MEKIIVTGVGRHEPKKGMFDYWSPEYNKMTVANNKAGIKDNLLWHGFKHFYLPEKNQWIFKRD